MAQENNQL